VPAGFLAALIVPAASATVDRASDCVEGAVGLWAQAASRARMEIRGNGFIEAPAERVS
jgi:hypothetical protein